MTIRSGVIAPWEMPPGSLVQHRHGVRELPDQAQRRIQFEREALLLDGSQNVRESFAAHAIRCNTKRARSPRRDAPRRGFARGMCSGKW